MKNIFTIISIALIASFSARGQSAGNCLDFDGVNDYVSANVPAVFNDIANNDFTVETWIKPEASSTQRVCFIQLDGSNFFSILLNSSNYPYIYVYNGMAHGWSTSTAIQNDVWTHIAVSWDASAANISLFINGESQTLSSGGTSSVGVNNTMTIGSRSDGMQSFQGEIDEFRIWTYAKPECDVKVGMNSIYSLSLTDLVIDYDFNVGAAGANNSGFTQLPNTANGNNATLNNFALNGMSSNWVSSGATIIFENQYGSSFNTSDMQAICQGESYQFGTQTLTTSGIYNEGFISSTGCDSIVQLDLTVNSVNSTVTQVGIVLTANLVGATYQWVDCNNGNSPIIGANGQSFTPVANGSYAVEVTDDGCTSMSTCYSITNVGLEDNDLAQSIRVYPNPTDGDVNINFGGDISDTYINIYDLNGKLIERAIPNNSNFDFRINSDPGVYIVEIISGQQKAVYRLVKI